MSTTALGGGATVPLKGPTEPRLRSRIAPLDGIRGIASLMVFFFHVPHLAATPGSLLSRWQLLSSVGWSGVDLFFVLSGFLITGILLDNCNSERYFGTFYRRRIHRIFPLYYLLLAIYAVCLAARVHLFDLFSSAPPVWWYFAGLQNFAMAAAGTYGGVWLAGTWSLAIEEQFYLLLPAAVYYIRSPKTLARIALALIVVAPLLRLLVEAVWPQNAFMETYLLLPTRIDTISVGVLLACAYRSESAWKCSRARGSSRCGTRCFRQWRRRGAANGRRASSPAYAMSGCCGNHSRIWKRRPRRWRRTCRMRCCCWISMVRCG